jgi:hypothetical protein
MPKYHRQAGMKSHAIRSFNPRTLASYGPTSERDEISEVILKMLEEHLYPSAGGSKSIRIYLPTRWF